MTPTRTTPGLDASDDLPAIEFDNAQKIYRAPDGSSVVALKGLSLAVRQGEFFGLLGPNGAGKTTAISLLSGVARISSGAVRILGQEVRSDAAPCKRLIGVVPQEIMADSFFDLRTMLRIQSKLSGVWPDTAWLEFLLDRLALSRHAGKTTRELSGGMKRRMMIARALAHKPRVLVLDEPTAGVDVELRHSMWDFIRELSALRMTIVLTTHYLEEAEQFCERIAILKSGELLTLKRGRELVGLGGKPRLQLLVPLPADRSRAEFHAWAAERWRDALARHHLLLAPLETTSEHGVGAKDEIVVEREFDERVGPSLVEGTRALAGFAEECGIAGARFSVAKPSLEDAFLRLTRD